MEDRPEPVFKLKKFNIIAAWQYNIAVEDCPICREPLTDKALGCLDQDCRCLPSEGECSHCFHICCVTKWGKQSKICPLCTQDWNPVHLGDEVIQKKLEHS